MDKLLFDAAKRAEARVNDAEHDLAVARAEFERAVRSLHLRGATAREIASSLHLSHQRVQQILEPRGWWRRAGGRGPTGVAACSFCGVPQRATQRLIAGPDLVFICDGCAHHAVEVLEGGAPVETQLGEICGTAKDVDLSCSFCGKGRTVVVALAALEPSVPGVGFVTICDECLELCADILSDAR